MKIFSKVYANSSFVFGSETIHFEGNAAEVSEELFRQIKESGFPFISDNENEKSDDKTFKEYNEDLQKISTEYASEITHLKNLLQGKDLQIAELKTDLQNWKTLYEKDVAALKSQLNLIKSVETSSGENKTEDVQLKKELESMKVPELEILAAESNCTAEEIKDAKTKANLIKLIMGKVSE